jgi:hypothetical protein
MKAAELMVGDVNQTISPAIERGSASLLSLNRERVEIQVSGKGVPMHDFFTFSLLPSLWTREAEVAMKRTTKKETMMENIAILGR